jgi:hypothetical protein
MWAFISLLPDWVKLPAAGLLGALVVSPGVFLYGKHEGRQAAAVDRLEADITAYVKREGIDHEVDGMERYRICLNLGGLPDDCGQLRGVEEATEGE